MTAIRMLTLGTALVSAALCGDAGAVDFATIFQYQNGNPGALVISSGTLYGTGFDVSDNGCGEIFQLQPPSAPGGDWSKTTIHSFAGRPSDGCGPLAAVAGPGGVLYGVTEVGGSLDGGTVYVLQPPAMPGGAWLENVLYSIPEGVGTPFGPVLAPDGNVYAGASNGGNGVGAIYQLRPSASVGGSWTATVAFNFPAERREDYPGSLSLGSDGAFYGTIPVGGNYKIDAGAVFKLQPPAVPGGSWTETILYDFRGGHDGATPNSVMLGPDGIVYGTTFGDNPEAYGTGTVFSLTPPATSGDRWIKKTLHTFSSRRAPGYYYGPDSPLIMRNGKLYGASGLLDTNTNKPGGLVYELSPPSTPGGEWTCTILHRWLDGQVPSFGSIAMEEDGRTLYGGTYVPDASEGTIYRISW